MAYNDNNNSAVNEVFIKPVVADSPEIGIDISRQIANNIIGAAEVGALDITSIDALSQSAQTREQSYQLIDSMAQDDVIAAVLETYAEDTVQTNDAGQIVWIESDDNRILDYTSWLLDSLNVDKHIYQWAYCLVTYGDVYLRLYRKSDVAEDKLFENNANNRKLNESKLYKEEPEAINEDVKLRIYANSDKYIPYVEMISNPGEMFDLQKFGKTYGYIKAPTRVMQQTSDTLYNYLTKYKMNQSDVEIFDATSFVHGCIENTTQRQPETVDIYLDSVNIDNDTDVDEYESKDSMTSSYTVKRGQSILYNSFRIWRELNLLEMSALLNRLTKSSVVRVLNVDVGDMPKEQVQAFMQRLKEKIEQKSAINTGAGIAEYTNPAPIENTIYVPTHGGQGQITPTTIGGDFDPKSLVDIEYFRDKLFGSLKVPKQYYGFTEDGAGFNGGQSLTILSSRYGKSIKNIQNILCQMITDLINLFLIDRNLNNYVNKFTVRMQTPVTQEELDRRTNTDNRIRYIGDLMQQLTDIEDKTVKLKIYKALLGSAINDPEVMSYLQEYIDILEAENAKQNSSDTDAVVDSTDSFSDSAEIEDSSEPELAAFETFNDTSNKDIINEADSEDDSYLPSPDELNIDMTETEN